MIFGRNVNLTELKSVGLSSMRLWMPELPITGFIILAVLCG